MRLRRLLIIAAVAGAMASACAPEWPDIRIADHGHGTPPILRITPLPHRRHRPHRDWFHDKLWVFLEWDF